LALQLLLQAMYICNSIAASASITISEIVV
jgi:hypothetical protein